MKSKSIYTLNLRNMKIVEYTSLQIAAKRCKLPVDSISHHATKRSMAPMNGFVFRFNENDFPEYSKETRDYVKYLGFPHSGTQQHGVVQYDEAGKIIFYGTGEEAAKHFGISTASEVHRGIKLERKRYKGCKTIHFPMGAQPVVSGEKSRYTREIIRKHWRPLRLRAIRLSKGLSLTAISERMGLTKAQINGWELGTRFEKYRNKKLIFQAYEVNEKDVEPTPNELTRLQQLLDKYTKEEIQMAYDIQTAEDRCRRYDESRRRGEEGV